MRKIFIAFVLYFVLCNPFLLYSQSNSQEQDKIQRTVSENMHIFTDSIPNYLLPNYGFNNRNEIQKAIIENPIKVYTIKNKEIIPTNTWRIPISIDGEYRALFTVIKEDNGEYLLVDFGAIRLAKEIQKRINGSKLIIRTQYHGDIRECFKETVSKDILINKKEMQILKEKNVVVLTDIINNNLSGYITYRNILRKYQWPNHWNLNSLSY